MPDWRPTKLASFRKIGLGTSDKDPKTVSAEILNAKVALFSLRTLPLLR